jgi:hypothetical protein
VRRRSGERRGRCSSSRTVRPRSDPIRSKPGFPSPGSRSTCAGLHVLGLDFCEIELHSLRAASVGLTPGDHGAGTQEEGEARHSIVQIPHPRHGEKTCFFLVGDHGQSNVRAHGLDSAPRNVRCGQQLTVPGACWPAGASAMIACGKRASAPPPMTTCSRQQSPGKSSWGVPALTRGTTVAVLEVRRSKGAEYSCWFVGETCQADPGIAVATPIDPLFLAVRPPSPPDSVRP